MSVIRVVARLPYFSGLPEDVVTNTFHFATVAAPTTTQITAMFQAVRDFYIGGTPTNSLGTLMHPSLSRTTDACVIEQYNLDDPEPRQPIDTDTFTLTNASGTGKMPLEASLCLSMRAAYASGSPNARRRGRVYLGPFNDNAATAGTASAYPTPNSTVPTQILASATQHLYATSAAENCFLAVYSTLDNIARNVVELWVDNAWDTQRRRGNGPTARTTDTVP